VNGSSERSACVLQGDRLDKPFVERAMTEAFGADQWVEVKGPDSMILR
jgi:hypothetical protein